MKIEDFKIRNTPLGVAIFVFVKLAAEFFSGFALKPNSLFNWSLVNKMTHPAIYEDVLIVDASIILMALICAVIYKRYYA